MSHLVSVIAARVLGFTKFHRRFMAMFTLMAASFCSTLALAAVPTINITSPAGGATLNTGTIVVSGTSSDDRYVRKVEAYMVLSSSTSAPYKVVQNTGTRYSTWRTSFNISTAGTYKIVARATDSAGFRTVTAIGVTVKQSTPVAAPVISITSPTSGTTYTTAQSVTLTASLNTSASIAKVEFYDGDTLAAADTSSPYNHIWSVTSSANGNHSWTAKAYDGAGNSVVSSPVTVTVNIPTGGSCSTEASALECEAFNLINQARAQQGLPALTFNNTLRTAAAYHNNFMVTNKCFDHVCSGEPDVGTRITDAGYGWSAYGETIAAGYATAASVVNAWLNSSGHRAILLGNYRDVGISAQPCNSGCPYSPYWTADFANPR